MSKRPRQVRDTTPKKAKKQVAASCLGDQGTIITKKTHTSDENPEKVTKHS